MLNRHGDKLVTEIQTNWKPDMLTCLHLMLCLFAFGRLCVNACICVRVNASVTYIYIYGDVYFVILPRTPPIPMKTYEDLY